MSDQENNKEANPENNAPENTHHPEQQPAVEGDTHHSHPLEWSHHRQKGRIHRRAQLPQEQQDCASHGRLLQRQSRFQAIKKGIIPARTPITPTASFLILETKLFAAIVPKIPEAIINKLRRFDVDGDKL